MSERVGLLGAALLSLSLVALVGTLLSPFETVIGGGGGGGDGAGFAASPDAAGRELRQRPPAKGGGRRRWRAERREENDPALVRTCERGDWSTPAECRRSLPCDLRAFDPGPAYNREVIQKSQPREWATNNVDAPNRYFQNGIEWWLHRALPPATPNASALTGARRVFVASYFSYMFIFAPHKVDSPEPSPDPDTLFIFISISVSISPNPTRTPTRPSSRQVEGSLAATSRGLGGAWRADPTHYVVAHGHPGACVAGTKAQTRLLVDACSSCQVSSSRLV